MAGLQDMAPTVAKLWVTSAVFAPIRAAALAASQPAWPPPITMTSNELEREIMARLLSRSQNSRKREVGGRPEETDLFHVKQRVPSPDRKVVHGKQVGDEMNEELFS